MPRAEPDRRAHRDRPRRVLFVDSYPQVLFGQQRTLLSLLEAGAGEIDPTIAVPGEGIFADQLRHRGFRVDVFPYPPSLARYGGAIYRYSAIGRLRTATQLAGYVREVRRRVKLETYDVVFCNDLRGLLTVGLAAHTLRLPVVIWDKLDRPHGWLDALQLPLASLNIVISEAVTLKYPVWQRRYFGARIVRVPDGVDTAIFASAQEKRRSLGFAERDLVFAVVGAITQRKGQDRLLAVLGRLKSEIPETRAVFVGAPASDEDRRYLEELRDRHDPRVTWLGMREDVPDIMRSIDVLVVPSRHEGLSKVALEAMAAGKPVVGARAGGIPEVIVDGETGLLFEGNAPDQLLDRLIRLGRSSDLRRRMGEAGRARVLRDFDQALQMRKVLDLLLQCGRTRAPAARLQTAESRDHSRRDPRDRLPSSRSRPVSRESSEIDRSNRARKPQR